MILRNHGLLTVGRSIAKCFNYMWGLEAACRAQVAAMACNTPLNIVPPEIVEALGAGKKPAVNVTVNGFAYRSTIATMGGKFMIAFSSDKRAATGLKGGDAITVTLELDEAPRTMAVPPDLQAALDKDKAAKAHFATLSYSNQRRHIDPIND
eukprot:gene52094-71007_t